MYGLIQFDVKKQWIMVPLLQSCQQCNKSWYKYNDLLPNCYHVICKDNVKVDNPGSVCRYVLIQTTSYVSLCIYLAFLNKKTYAKNNYECHF